MRSLRSQALAVSLALVAVLVSGTLLLSRQVMVSRFDEFVRRGESREASDAVSQVQAYVDRTHSLLGIKATLDEIHARTGALLILFQGARTIAAVPTVPNTINIFGEPGGVRVLINDGVTQSELVLKGGIPEIVDGGKSIASLIVLPKQSGERREFGVEVNRSLVWVALGIGAFGMLLGGWVAGRLVKPVERLKEQNEQQRRSLLNDVAHELRTPLTHVRAELEALQDGMRQPTPAVIDRLHADTRHLQQLVDDLSDLSQAEAGQLRLSIVGLDISRALREAAASVETMAAAKGIRIVHAHDEALPPVAADPARLRQILVNLLDNAIRYAPRDSTVKVSAARENDRQVRISVSDEGDGVAVEQLPRLFDRFFRADESRDRRTGGAGLGLAIVKQLATLQGGSVDAANLSPRGFRVSVMLPRHVSTPRHR